MALAGGTQGGFDDLEIDQVSPAAQSLEHLGFQVAGTRQPRQELLAGLGVVTDAKGADQRSRDALRLAEGKNPRNGLGSGHPQALSEAEGEGWITDPRQEFTEFLQG